MKTRPADPVRAVREVKPGRAWRGETGGVHLPGIPARVRGKQAGQVRSPAHYGRQTKAEEAARTEAGTTPEDARADCNGRRMAAERAARLLPIPCGSGEPGGAVAIPASGGSPVVQNSVPAQSAAAHLDETGAGPRPLVTHPSCCACVSGCSFRRQAPCGVTSKVRTVCSSFCKYGSVRGVAGNGHPYRNGCYRTATVRERFLRGRYRDAISFRHRRAALVSEGRGRRHGPQPLG